MKRKADAEATDRRRRLQQLPTGTSSTASARSTGTAHSPPATDAIANQYTYTHDIGVHSSYTHAHPYPYDYRDHYQAYPYMYQAYEYPPPHPFHAWDASAWNVAHPPSVPLYMYDAADVRKFQGWEKRFREALKVIGDTEYALLPQAMAIARYEAHDMKLCGALLDDIVRRCRRDAEQAGMKFTAPPAPPPTAVTDAVAQEASAASSLSSPSSTPSGARADVGGPIENGDAGQAGQAEAPETDADADADGRPEQITWEQGESAGVPSEKVLRERYPPPSYIGPPRSFHESYEQKQYRIRLMIDAHHYMHAGGTGGSHLESKSESKSKSTSSDDAAAGAATPLVSPFGADHDNSTTGPSRDVSVASACTCTCTADAGDRDEKTQKSDAPGKARALHVDRSDVTCNEDFSSVHSDTHDDFTPVGLGDDDDDCDNDDGDGDDKGSNVNGSESGGALNQSGNEEATGSSSSHYSPPTYNLGLSFPDEFYCDPPWWSNMKKTT